MSQVVASETPQRLKWDGSKLEVWAADSARREYMHGAISVLHRATTDSGDILVALQSSRGSTKLLVIDGADSETMRALDTFPTALNQPAVDKLFANSSKYSGTTIKGIPVTKAAPSAPAPLDGRLVVDEGVVSLQTPGQSWHFVVGRDVMPTVLGREAQADKSVVMRISVPDAGKKLVRVAPEDVFMAGRAGALCGAGATPQPSDSPSSAAATRRRSATTIRANQAARVVEVFGWLVLLLGVIGGIIAGKETHNVGIGLSIVAATIVQAATLVMVAAYIGARTE